MDGEAWLVTVPWGHKKSGRTKQLTLSGKKITKAMIPKRDTVLLCIDF